MKKIIFVLSLLQVCLAATAQETVPDSTDVFYKHLQLNEIVVTGLAGDSKMKEMPAPVSVIRPADLNARAGGNIIHAIAAEPGISEITTGGGISKPVIRGMGYNRVIVVNDGIRQEGQQWGDEHGIEIDGAGVHSVEVLKGPASLMYGSDALAGILIFHPEPVRGPGEFGGSFSSEYQTNSGLLAYSLAADGNIGGWLVGGRFSDKYAHAYKNALNGLVANSGYRERAASGLLGRNGSWGYSRLRFSYFHLTPGMIEGEGDNFGYTPALPFQQVRHFKVVSDNTIHMGPGNLKFILGWQQNRRQEYEESDQEPGLDFRLNTVNYDLRYQATFGNGWKTAFGLAGMGQVSDNLGDEYLIPAYSLFDAGLFATVTKALGQWTLSGGLRVDVRWLHSKALPDRFEDFSRRFPGVSASLGAVRPLGEHFTFRANVARGFRAPNLAELGSNGEHEGTFRFELGNKDLKPEYSLQGDLGLDFVSKYVSVQSALFISRVDNYIFAARNGQVSEEGLPVYAFRSGLAHLGGGEVGIDVHPIHSLHLSSAFSCVYAREKGGDDLPLIPAPRLFSEVKWEFTHDGQLFNNAFVSLNVDWNMAQNHFYAAGGTETATPAYWLLGASAGTDLFIKGKTRLSLYIIASNLADKAYMPHLSRLKYIGIANMGRNVSFKIVVPF
ncbi:MAG: TonB-dependent receptor [Bacteroidales bacterium]|nr:TonB-dependent receptor [Bacteroidales bacterium]